MKRLCKTNVDARLEAKAAKSASGEISGYAAIWDLVDADRDVILPGAFRRSIANQIKARSVPLMVRHFRDGGDAMESVGVIAEAREDDIGFWVRAELDGSDASQELRQKVASNPGIFGMSVGWTNVQNGYAQMPDGGRKFREMNLKEITVTLLPSQSATLGTVSGKSMDETIEDIHRRLEALEGKATEEENDENAQEEPPAVDVQALLDASKRREQLLKELNNG